MKISEKRIYQIIAEEKKKILSEQNKVNGARSALKEIAMQSAEMHGADNRLANMDEKDLKKIKSLAEQLDSIFYRIMAS
tara:strand:+ start:503 stop:739 length:237 start_codon:yes stop_codon:yes gene_type:complete